ncbi:hypothetical protein J2Z82_000441 [Virgibacillus litoralis]|uniref:Uncharacterized protein n=1 Tax=Virgibacillus litoralis TaxID=578221 RepID=A0ABS4H9G9_9BACI|nr:hypothetical protein [Virgibacillus litoralis]
MRIIFLSATPPTAMVTDQEGRYSEGRFQAYQDHVENGIKSNRGHDIFAWFSFNFNLGFKCSNG